MSVSKLNAFVQHSNDEAFVRSELLRAFAARRKNGKSLVPVLLDELTTHSARIPAGNAPTLLNVLFSIADQITRPEDAERGFATADTHLRIHWLIRRLVDGRKLEEKSALYMAAAKGASLGWLVDFADSAIRRYTPRDGRAVDPENLLITEDAVPQLKALLLEKLQIASENGDLASSSNLLYGIYRWIDYSDDKGDAARAWIQNLMKTDAGLVTVAKALTGESWSSGMGGFGSLGDRVSRRHTRAQIPRDFDLFDLEAFRAELQRVVREKKVSPEDIDAVQAFLSAWDKRIAGDD